jgi:hypothetical protein
VVGAVRAGDGPHPGGATIQVVAAQPWPACAQQQVPGDPAGSSGVDPEEPHPLPTTWRDPPRNLSFHGQHRDTGSNSVMSVAARLITPPNRTRHLPPGAIVAGPDIPSPLLPIPRRARRGGRHDWHASGARDHHRASKEWCDQSGPWRAGSVEGANEGGADRLGHDTSGSYASYEVSSGARSAEAVPTYCD